jgi:hypothetical protein
MTSTLDAILERYSGRSGDPSAGATPDDAANAWRAATSAQGTLGAALVRDSARRRWTVEVHRDASRGRLVVVSPVQGDNEPFRASADGYRPDTHLRISANEWSLLALLAFGHQGDDGREDEELRTEAFRLVDRMVVAAQHQMLMGAAEDEDDE